MKEARNLVLYQKKATLGTKDIETAVKLFLKGELRKQALTNAAQTLSKYAEARKNWEALLLLKNP